MRSQSARLFRAMATVALACVGIYSSTSASATEVWMGGGLAWKEFHVPSTIDQWKFCSQNVQGLYINNFATRYKGDDEKAALLQKMVDTKALLKTGDVFYETDLVHDPDAHDIDALAMFKQAGLTLKGTTINYGLNASRRAILKADDLPLYYMYGPWKVKGNINDPSNAALRQHILDNDGASVDGPVVMWAPNKAGTRQGVISGIKFCHANGKKFLYLLAPNDSGPKFLSQSQQLLHELEDKDAIPDILAVAFYGPKNFRDNLDILPESKPDGQPASTFTGVVYWAIHHLHDPKKWANLQLPSQDHVDGTTTLATWSPTKTSDTFTLDLANDSTWLDLAPVVRVRCDDPEVSPGAFTWHLGDRDVTAEINSRGLAFVRELRLQPHDRRTLTLCLNPTPFPSAHAATLRIELLANPSETTVNQRMTLTVAPTKSAR